MFGFSMSKEQKMIKEEVAKLVKSLVADNIHDMDEAGEIPSDVIQKAWSLGASVSKVPEAYGGYGMKDSPLDTAIILEELAYGDMAFAIAATLPSLFIFPLTEMGTEAQKKKYLPLYCTENFKPGTLALNEPRFGFDAFDLKTTAVKKNGSYILNGVKCFVPMADQSSHLLVAASLEGRNQLFIVDRNHPGVTVGQRERNIGLYALPSHEVTLADCEIPAEDRLGESAGCDYDRFLQKTRIGMAAMAAGVTRASYEFARDYAKERVQFGEPIVYRQTIAFMIAEMAYESEAIKLMAWNAASKLEAGKDAKREAYLAKLYAGEMGMKIADYGVQILGGHGYVRDYPVERYYRNGRGIAILEGMAIV
jgi:alkylation response protein AidB-like acyl-CoA dehydrogenase